MTPVMVVMVPSLLLMALALAVTPRLTRRELFFAVTVDPHFRESAEGRGARKAYELWLLAHALVALALVVLLREHRAASMAGPLYLLAGATHAYLLARRRTLPHAVAPSPLHEAALTPRGPMPYRAFFVPPLVALAAITAVVARRYPSLPDRLAVHFDASGAPNRFAAKSVAEVFAPLIMGAVMSLVLLGLSSLIWNARRVRSEGAGAAAEARFRRLTVATIAAATWVLASNTGLAALAISGLVTAPAWLFILPVPLVLGTTAVLLWMGQGGSRLAPTPSTPIGDRTQDRYWKAGLFYVNRDDPAVVVEKRFGIGYTLNFANPISWLLLAMLLLPGLLPLFLAH